MKKCNFLAFGAVVEILTSELKTINLVITSKPSYFLGLVWFGCFDTIGHSYQLLYTPGNGWSVVTKIGNTTTKQPIIELKSEKVRFKRR